MNQNSVGLDPETDAELTRQAEANGRSKIGQIRWMLKHSDTARAPITDSNSTVCQGAGGVEAGEEKK